MTDEQYCQWFKNKYGEEPNEFQRRMQVGLPMTNHKVQPDVQFYRPYRGERVALTGSPEQRRAKIRELDRAEYGHEADNREVVNLD